MLVAREGSAMRNLMLIVHAAAGDVGKVEGALRDGVSPDVADSGGWTPLHLAAGLGQVDVVRSLLERGADPTVRNRLGDTALHVAIMQGRAEAAFVLLERGGARLLEIPSDSGRTPLDCLEIWPLPGDDATHEAIDSLLSVGPGQRDVAAAGRPVAVPWSIRPDVPRPAEAACP